MNQELPDIDEIIPEVEEGETRQWLTTYADMITLLLTFFVMMLAISSLDNERFEEVMTSIQFTLGSSSAIGGKKGRLEMQNTTRQAISRPSGRDLEPLLKNLREAFKEKDLDDAIAMRIRGNKIVLRTKGPVLFTSGSTTLAPQAAPILRQIAKVIRDHPRYRLDIKGHTDNQPLSGGRLKDNWELSAVRATEVLRFLVGAGAPARRLTATGLAGTDPLAPNTSDANRAKNRRVEFVLEKLQRPEQDRSFTPF